VCNKYKYFATNFQTFVCHWPVAWSMNCIISNTGKKMRVLDSVQAVSGSQPASYAIGYRRYIPEGQNTHVLN